MKNKMVTLLALSTLASVAVSTSVFADSEPYASTGTVEFKASTDKTNPVDPTDPNPGTPVKPENPDGTPANPGTEGPLSLDFASSLDFGIQKITSSDETYNASAQRYTKADGSVVSGPDYVQLTDNRGTFAGWSLKVKQLDQFKTAAGVALDGAAINFGDLKHVTANTDTTGVTTSSTFTLDGSSAAEQVVMSGEAAGTGKVNGTSGTHLLTFGDVSSLVTADKNEDDSSRGTTDSDVTLTVPGASSKRAEKYATTMQWTVAETPSAVVK